MMVISQKTLISVKQGNKYTCSNYMHCRSQRRRHGVDWGGRVHPTFFKNRFCDSPKFDEKMGGGVISHFPFLLRDFQADGFDKEDGAPSKRRRTIPACFRDGSSFLHDDGLVAAAQAQVASTSGQASSTFKRDFYLPVLDRLVSELEKRFSSDACKLLSDASVLHPTKFDETNVEKVASIAEWYGSKSEMAANEFVLLSKSNEVASWKKEYFDYVKEKETAENNQITKKPQAWLCLPTLLNVFKTNSLHNLYPNIFNVVKVVATLPVTVASCERAHSKIKIINNYLRASMSDDRLENLVQISIERDMAGRIELDSLVDKFKAAGSRKLPL